MEWLVSLLVFNFLNETKKQGVLQMRVVEEIIIINILLIINYFKKGDVVLENLYLKSNALVSYVNVLFEKIFFLMYQNLFKQDELNLPIKVVYGHLSMFFWSDLKQLKS